MNTENGTKEIFASETEAKRMEGVRAIALVLTRQWSGIIPGPNGQGSFVTAPAALIAKHAVELHQALEDEIAAAARRKALDAEISGARSS